MSVLHGARVLDAGETALVVEYGDRADMAIHDRVMALDIALREATIDGIRETVPTYRSLMIHYDPLELNRADLLARLSAMKPAVWQRAATSWRLPVCFHPELADDLREAASQLGLSAKALEDGLLHSVFRLYMYGFAPGLAYLGGLVAELALPRRATPRPQMPASSVIIAGGLAAISGPVPMPTGWYVVGITPVSMFAVERQGHVPFAVGDRIAFEAVDRSTFELLKKRDDAGECVWRRAE